MLCLGYNLKMKSSQEPHISKSNCRKSTGDCSYKFKLFINACHLLALTCILVQCFVINIEDNLCAGSLLNAP